MNNPYKRLDIFRCNQEAHRAFQGRVSVYHVLREKKCYPAGCTYFLWHCVLLEKGNPCVRGYRYVGKNCMGCTYYDAEKIHLQPELRIRDEEYQAFLEEMNEFESWLARAKYRKITAGGKISFIKPWFENTLAHRESHLHLRGALLVFKRGYFDKILFDDTFYVRFPVSLIKTYRFVPKMKIELEGELRVDRGRMIVHRPKKIEIMTRGWGRPIDSEHMLVAVKTATRFQGQPENCFSCPWGALCDVTDYRSGDGEKYRNSYCLKGVENPDTCIVRGLEKVERKSPIERSGPHPCDANAPRT